MATFFHLYAHDQSGPLGEYLRCLMTPVHALFPNVDDRTFAIAFASLFMQVTGILQTPFFLGASWSPFEDVKNALIIPAAEPAPVLKESEEKIKSNPQDSSLSDDDVPKKKKKKRKNKQKSA